MTREARRGERRLSCGSLHWHQVLLEPRHSFTSPESWIPRDWQFPLNRAPTWLATHWPQLVIAVWVSAIVTKGQWQNESDSLQRIQCKPIISKDGQQVTNHGQWVANHCQQVTNCHQQPFLLMMLFWWFGAMSQAQLPWNVCSFLPVNFSFLNHVGQKLLHVQWLCLFHVHLSSQCEHHALFPTTSSHFV